MTPTSFGFEKTSQTRSRQIAKDFKFYLRRCLTVLNRSVSVANAQVDLVDREAYQLIRLRTSIDFAMDCRFFHKIKDWYNPKGSKQREAVRDSPNSGSPCGR